MSKRNGFPKPSASERTQRRWRERHDISTPADEAHRSYIQEIKDKISEWRKPKVKAVKVENDLVVKQ